MRCATLSESWQRLAKAVIARVYEHASRFRAEGGRRIHGVLMKGLPPDEARAIWNEGTAASRLSQKPRLDAGELDQLCDEVEVLLDRYNAGEGRLHEQLEVMLTIASEAMKLPLSGYNSVSGEFKSPVLALIADFQSIRSMYEALWGGLARSRHANQDLVEDTSL